MKVLGIDPGLAHLGIGVVAGDVRKAQHLYHSCVLTSAQTAMPERLLTLYQAVEHTIHTYTPDFAAIEEQYLKLQGDTGFKVGQAYGVVLLVCAQNNIPVFYYGPMQVKQALVGTGRATKEQVIYMVKAQLKLATIHNNHAADALALALTHLASSRFKNLAH